MSSRFYIPTPINAERVTHGGAEGHHFMHVCRVTAGQTVKLFDGSGAEFTAVVEKVTRSTVELRIVERNEVDRELPFALVVGVSLPKGDRQKWLIEKLTEIGASKLVPLVTQRGVAQPTDNALERLSRSVIEAAKQCGRNRLMEIAPPQAWDAWISKTKVEAEARKIVAHPGGTALGDLQLFSPNPVYLAIGPEGGLADAEIAMAVATGWQAVSLGSRILRIETSAIVLAGWFALHSRTEKSPSAAGPKPQV
jgi:16S rRNA (uracil1498-N3)-methyltransferase